MLISSALAVKYLTAAARSIHDLPGSRVLKLDVPPLFFAPNLLFFTPNQKQHG
jgi:hypothetical protein